MNEFWKNAVKFTGIGGVVFFVLWYVFKDIIAKFTSLTSDQSFMLGGLIIVMVAILASKAIDRNHTNKVEEPTKDENHNDNNSNSATIHNSSVKIDGDSSGNIVTGDGNSVNSEERAKLRAKKEQESRDSSVTLSGTNAGNIVTGDGNSVG